VVVDGRRIASRGQPGTPEAGIWVSIVPGYTVLDKNDGEDIVASGLRAGARYALASARGSAISAIL
jgi:hypothetical protein